MATKKPLVLGLDGSIQQLQAGDSVEVGAAAQTFTATNNNAGPITIGQAVYVDSTGTVDLSIANADVLANTIGLVNDASVAAGSPGVIITDGILSSADWSAVTGTALLTAGAKYFLDDATAGMLTDVPPVLAGSYITLVGTAISEIELEVSIRDTIKL